MSKQREIAVTGYPLYNSFVFNKVIETNGVVNLKAHPFEEESRTSRAPVDLIAVIDVSGSMSGSKIELVKQTLHFVLDQLKPDDRIAIITFHSSVKVELTLTELTNTGKSIAKRITNELRPQGGTFLSGGLIEGLQMLVERSSSKRKNEVASLLFLTDGQATDGIRDVAQIQSTVQSFAAQIPDVISINTFGFGADHDANLLRTISDTANGMFYFIEKVPDIAQAFADCLGGLLSTVAQKISVEIEAAENVTITNVHTTYKVTNVQQGKKYVITLNDLFGDEERDIVLDLRLSPLTAPQGNSALVIVKVQYNNLITKAPGNVVGNLSVERTATELEREPNIHVLRQVHRLGVAKVLKMAAEAGIRNDIKGGQEMLQATIDKINRETPKDEFCQKLVGELKTAQSAMQTVTSYASPGYASIQAQQITQCQQRSNTSTPMYSNVQQQQMQTMATNVFAQQPQVPPQRTTAQSAQPMHFHSYSPYQRPTSASIPSPQQPLRPPTTPQQQTLSFDFTNYQQQQQPQTITMQQIQPQQQLPRQAPQQIPQQMQQKPQQPQIQQQQQVQYLQQVQQQQPQQQQQQQLLDFTIPTQLQTPLFPQQTLSPQKK